MQHSLNSRLCATMVTMWLQIVSFLLAGVILNTNSFSFPEAAEPNNMGGGSGGGNSGGSSSELSIRQGFPNLTTGGPLLPMTSVGGSVPPMTTPATILTPMTAQPVQQQQINQTCICVPTGRCTTPALPNDGSGLIDIRIVNTPITTPIVNGTIIPGIVSPITCQAGLERCCQPGSYQCGVRHPPMIGSRAPTTGQAAFGAYPWQAVLLGPGDVYAGSGALIDSLNVLTAAHKVVEFQTSGRALKVRLGEWDASAETEPVRSQEYIVSRILIHPNYTANNLRNDVALLRLSTPVTLGTTPTVTTACLPAVPFSGLRCWVSGWGKNDFSNTGQFQAIQKEVDVPMRTVDECQNALRSTRLGATFLLDSMSFLCAGGEVGKDACTGDGGSPLMCEMGGRWFAAGLVAWGIGCATGGVPGVYVNLVNFVPWIQATLRA